jgi:hypothetical protein
LEPRLPRGPIPEGLEDRLPAAPQPGFRPGTRRMAATALNPDLAFWFFESVKMHFQKFKKPFHIGVTAHCSLEIAKKWFGRQNFSKMVTFGVHSAP